MSITKYLISCVLGVALWLPARAGSADTNSPFLNAGPLYDRYHLTLAPGERTEMVSPFFYSQHSDTEHAWGLPPLMAFSHDSATEALHFYLAYPTLTYYRFGAEHRWQLFQLLSTAGGQEQEDSQTHRFTLFPIYFQQRSPNPTNNYTAVVPFYGHLQHRLFRDEIDFVLFPGYSRTVKKDVVTYNMPYPFYHKRYGNGLRGYQVWPFYGHEIKVPTLQTNTVQEVVTNGGHESEFLMWPFFFASTNGIGTDNPSGEKALIPLRVQYRSRLRDSDNWGWPLGITHTVDREKKYEEWDAPWPFVEFAHGEGKSERRFFPFFNQDHDATMVDNWYMWPIYKYNSIHSPPLERERTRIVFFLYSDLKMRSTETGRHMRRTDMFPFFTRRRDLNGDERLQVLAIMEPFFPGNTGVEREYAPFYSLWRAEKNARTGAASQSLLWNLYRRETAAQSKKISLLFGLFQYQSSSTGRRWRVCYIPVGKNTPAPASEPTTRH